ncbi:uncharacterized protein LOC104582138 [Brachypodium distachyon]|uniref:uncharacterized protein LOC104582138 n=1 Tax=Brachypodium distachyon TaxID=15368 RepID=UPI0005300027|nr:uncharacterized protein LOC104582138 [Brachypodium distachyon]|eukprot:XP_010229788.1 uncharacterized protein LOC104582138 [Brachypodium distachyon]
MEGYCMLYAYYFVDDPLHNDVVFRRRFRMSGKLFLKIAEYLWEYDDYFKLKRDAVSTLDFTTIQKCTVSFQLLAEIVAVFGDMYLRTPTAEDTAGILAQNAEKGFPGTASPVNYEINGHVYNKGYYLADDIYPRWSAFVKTISNPPPGGPRSWFATQQEACRKDVERAFGLLQA